MTSAAPTKPWFAGAFSGQYDAKLAHIELKVGAVRDWSLDDGKLASGPGSLLLTIDDAGRVEGVSQGALGASHATGMVEDDTLRVSLVPTDPADQTALAGVLIASREGDGFKGTLQASSVDSSKVRQAAVDLKKQAH